MATSQFTERRHHLRIYIPFPAMVEGLNEDGHPFQAHTALDDLSAGGLSLRLAERVQKGAQLSVTARLAVVTKRGMVVRLTGKVVRVEPKPGGAFSLAMEIEDRRIL